MRRVQLASVLGLGLLISACGPGRTESVLVDETNEANWLGESILAVETVVGIEVIGDRRADTIGYVFEGTVSSTTVEIAMAESLKVGITLERTNEALVFGISEPDKKFATLTGKITFTVPAELALELISTEGGVLVSGIEGPMIVTARDNSRIEGAESDVQLSVGRGTAELETLALQGTQAEVRTNGGAVQVNLPNPLSVEVQVSTTGAVQINHPELPLPLANSGPGYAAVVRNGLSRLVVVAGRGNVTLAQR